MWELYDVTLLVIVSFKFQVMNFVDFVFNCYTHITSHVSQAFASCTHYTSYYLLNIVHVTVCLWSNQPSLQILWVFYAKQILMLENLWKMDENLNFGKIGLKTLFWKTLHHILMHFVHQFQCFEVFLKCVFVIFKNFVFSQKFCEPLSNSIDPLYFSFNRNCFKSLKEVSVCFDWSKLSLDQLKLLWSCLKIF